jgi:ABC-type transport system involved in cytochrome bd biosynthesis fused ATPase/permease subunit
MFENDKRILLDLVEHYSILDILKALKQIAYYKADQYSDSRMTNKAKEFAKYIFVLEDIISKLN